MGNVVDLILRNVAGAVDDGRNDGVILWLTANDALPSFWVALLGPDDVGGWWESRVRACLADPQSCPKGLPPLAIGWSSARTMLDRPEARAATRVPPVADAFGRWAVALRVLGEKGGAEEVRLYLGEFADFGRDADAFLADLRQRIDVWQGDDAVQAPPSASVGNDLCGIDEATGAVFPPGLAGRASVRGHRPVSPPISRRENRLDWAVTIMCAVTILSSAMLGNWLYGRAGFWIGEALGAVAFALFAWQFHRWRKQRA